MKLKKLFLYNLIAIICLFIAIELSSYVFLCTKYKEDIINFRKIMYPENKINLPLISYKIAKNQSEKSLYDTLRPISYKDSKKNPIVLFGCSYTDGFGLNENETFSFKLSEYTNRTVYNRGRSATGIPFMYHQLINKDIVNLFPKNTDVFIYTLIPDHFSRLFRYRSWIMNGDHTIKYKLNKENKLVRDKIKVPLLHTFFTSIIIEQYIENKQTQNYENTKALSIKLFEESYKQIKNNFDNAKFVILYIECPLDGENIHLNYIKEFATNTNNNIVLINANEHIQDLKTNKKYWLNDDSHPSALFWDTIIPILSKELKL